MVLDLEKSPFAEEILKIATQVGRKLFENGHFQFATLSSYHGLPPDDLKKNLVLQEALQILPQKFIWEFSTIQQIEIISVQVMEFTNHVSNFLTAAAYKGLNQLDDTPSQSQLASTALRNLRRVNRLQDETAENLTQLKNQWQQGLDKFLSQMNAAPHQLCSFTNANCRELLFNCPMQIGQQLSTTGLSLVYYAKGKVLTNNSTPIWNLRISYSQVEKHLATREKILQFLLNYNYSWLFQIQLLILEENLEQSLQETQAHINQLDSLLQLLAYQERAQWGAKNEVGTGSGTREIPGESLSKHLLQPKETTIACANFAFLRALERQLFFQGVETKTSSQLMEQLFSYASQHMVLASEILDDEILAMAPAITKEQLVEAKLRARMNDEEYPLSVSFRSQVLNSAEAVSPTRGG